MYRILVIGAVKTTKHVIEQLVLHGFTIVGIMGHEPKNIDRVSGWTNLKKLAYKNGLEYKGYNKINEEENINWAESKKPEIIFAVGFSQLLSNEWLKMPRLGCIGFHPTRLPEGRGRAPLAWLVLDEAQGAATFFLMGEGADDGPIFVQEVFEVSKDDDADTVEDKIEVAIKKALSRWLPELQKGIWNPVPQDEEKASWTGKRSLEDGVINWNNPAIVIDRLIKATSRPHPGAYSYFRDEKITIWSSEVEENYPIKGVVGRILVKEEGRGYLIQCGDGSLLWLKEMELLAGLVLKVGDKLGYNIENEIYEIKKTLKHYLK